MRRERAREWCRSGFSLRHIKPSHRNAISRSFALYS